MSAYARGAYTLRESPRDANGHDAGHIHATRPVTVREGDTYLRETACGRTLGQYGMVSHGSLGPTCRACKAALA